MDSPATPVADGSGRPPNRWVAGARPRTLPAAVVPVLVGTAVAWREGQVVWWRAAAALVVALAVQVATNYANDYSDGVRGTDDAAVRVGPVRLVASGMASPPAVRRAALIAFGVAGVAGLALAAAAGWWLVLVGAASMAAGWLYTGGPRPYGYAALGEVFVFAFFGIVATVGSAYVHLEAVSPLALLAALPVGLLATSLLVVNNLRDLRGDEQVGKLTLAVRVGEDRTRWLYAGCVAFALGSLLYIAASGPLLALLALLALPLAVPPVRRVLGGESGRGLIEVLMATGRLQLAFGILLALGIAAS